MPQKPKSIFISYAWGGESEQVANEIDERISSQGLRLIRDKKDLGFKGLIKEFMQEIGQGMYVVLVISDKYLKSSNCMFELLEIQKNGKIYDRVFPVVLPDATIYKSVGIINYLKYWEDQIEELNDALKNLDSFADTQGIREDIDLYTEIRATIAQLAALFRNMNTLTLSELRKRDYAPLLDLLQHQSSRSDPQQGVKKPSTKYGKILYHIPDMMQLHAWTKCIVRLAWDELLLEEGLNLEANEKVIEKIRLGKVMEVCLEEAKNEANFEIATNCSKEQFIAEDDYTEWIFNVKAKNEGVFTLIIKVTLIQLIEGFGERKRDIVLERKVKTEAFVPEPVRFFESSEEKLIASDTSIVSGRPKPPAMPTPSLQTKGPKSHFSFRKIMPYAASIMLLCIAGAVMWPELRGTFQDSPASSQLNTERDSTTSPSLTIPANQEIKLPPTNSVPSMENPPLPQESIKSETPKHGETLILSPAILITLPKDSLVLVGIKKGVGNATVSLTQNDYLFLVHYKDLKNIILDSTILTAYPARDSIKLENHNIKVVKANTIQNLILKSGSSKSWKLKGNATQNKSIQPVTKTNN